MVKIIKIIKMIINDLNNVIKVIKVIKMIKMVKIIKRSKKFKSTKNPISKWKNIGIARVLRYVFEIRISMLALLSPQLNIDTKLQTTNMSHCVNDH